MLGRPTFRHIKARARLAGASLALGAMVSLGSGCFPEEALSSYMGGARSDAVVTSTNTSRADAGPVPRDAGPTREPVPEVPDASEARDAGAAPAQQLACRDECTCEARGSLEFMFCAPPVTRTLAVERCALAGGSLVSVEDEALNTWLSERMQALDADDFWLSGSDEDTEGVWLWGDGRVFYGGDAGAGAYAPWDEGQPNDVNDEDCMRATAGAWRDLDCADEIAYVCQG